MKTAEKSVSPSKHLKAGQNTQQRWEAHQNIQQCMVKNWFKRHHSIVQKVNITKVSLEKCQEKCRWKGKL